MHISLAQKRSKVEEKEYEEPEVESVPPPETTSKKVDPGEAVQCTQDTHTQHTEYRSPESRYC
jgi:hypothetical protein